MPFFIPRTVHLAQQVLPAAGAFTAQDFFTIPRGVRELSYWITYTRGAAGGYPTARVQWGNDVDEAVELVIDRSSVTVAQPYATFNIYGEQGLFPAPSTDNPFSYVLPVVAPYGATKGRILVAEAGVVGTPGSILIAYTGGVGAP